MAESGHSSITHWEAAAGSRWGQYVTDHERTNLLFALERLAPAMALDVGCEGGRWSKLLLDYGWAVVATDVDSESLAVCQRRLPQASCILVSEGDATLPIQTHALRLLLIYEVHAVMESSWILDEAARVLEPGGMLVCSTWNPRSLRGAAYRALAMLDRRERAGVRRFQDFYRGPPYTRFRSDLRAHGFEVLRERGICWFPFTRDSDSQLIDLATGIETRVGLTRLPSLSPWVLTVAATAGPTEVR